MVCEQKRQLSADYLERTQALAVEAELLLDTLGRERENNWSYRWNRVEQARINCDIARLALSTHTHGHRC
jgi:hypothetical protein